MKKALCVATILLAAGFANAELIPLQIVASEYDMPEGNQATQPLGDPTSLDDGMTPHCVDYENPVTLNIWANLGLAPDKVWNGLGLGVHTTGGITASVNLDILSDAWTVRGSNGRFIDGDVTFARWNSGSDNYADDTGDNCSMVAVTEAGLGGDGDIGIGATSAYDPGAAAYELTYRGTWFKIGTIEVGMGSGVAGEVYLSYQPTNFVGGSKGESIIYYGYNAAGIVNSDDNIGVLGNRPFMTLNIPEPASLILLALAALAIRRR